MSATFTEGNGPSNIIVVLLGWAGAVDIHLKKYTHIYKEQGFSTLRFISLYTGSNGGTNSLAPADVGDLPQRVREILGNGTNHLLFHVFSMNGVMTLTSLILQPNCENIFQRTVGVIFDSCPICKDDLGVHRKVIEFSIGPQYSNTWYSQFCKEMKIWTTIQARRYYLARIFFLNKVMGVPLTKLVHYFFLLEHPEIPKKQLYLYSDADEICDSRQIQQFHEAQTQKGNNISFVNFGDSKHVEHYRKYPTEYTNAVSEFMKTIVDRKSKL